MKISYLFFWALLLFPVINPIYGYNGPDDKKILGEADGDGGDDLCYVNPEVKNSISYEEGFYSGCPDVYYVAHEPGNISNVYGYTVIDFSIPSPRTIGCLVSLSCEGKGWQPIPVQTSIAHLNSNGSFTYFSAPSESCDPWSGPFYDFSSLSYDHVVRQCCDDYVSNGGFSKNNDNNSDIDPFVTTKDDSNLQTFECDIVTYPNPLNISDLTIHVCPVRISIIILNDRKIQFNQSPSNTLILPNSVFNDGLNFLTLIYENGNHKSLKILK